VTAYFLMLHMWRTRVTTRRSLAGYVVFLLNRAPRAPRAPVVWYSKRQNTVETSTFSAEFVALKVCLEAIEHLRFTLRCFGVPTPQGEPSCVLCDNKSVVKKCNECRIDVELQAFLCHISPLQVVCCRWGDHACSCKHP
jgi:hypothetical protein